MNHADAVIEIAMGVAAIVFGGTAKEFYALGPGQQPKPNTERIPRWVGRVLCIGIGVLLVCWSLPGLRGPWHWHDLWVDWWFFAFFAAAWLLNRVLRAIGTRNSENKFQTLHLSATGDETSAKDS